MHLGAAPAVPTLPVTDLKRARRFYEDKLGLKLVHEADGEVALAAGDTVLYLYQRPPASSEHTLACFVVDDVPGAVRDLRRKGVQFQEYDLPDLKTVDFVAETPDGKQAAWFTDPDGNILGISQVPEGLFGRRRHMLGSAEEELNRRAIRRLWREAAEKANPAIADEIYAQNVRYHGFGGMELKGRDEVKEMILGYQAAFTDMKVKFHDIVTSGDRTVTRTTVTGRHVGEFEGVEPTGKTVSFDGLTISRWKDGEIVEEWEAFDMEAALEQLRAK